LCLWFETSSISPLIRGSRLVRPPWLAWHARDLLARADDWHCRAFGVRSLLVCMERSSGGRTHAHARKAGGPQARLSTVVAFYYRSRGAAGQRCGELKVGEIVAQVTSSLGDERLRLARPGSSLKRVQRPYLDFVGGTGEDRIE